MTGFNADKINPIDKDSNELEKRHRIVRAYFKNDFKINDILEGDPPQVDYSTGTHHLDS